MTHPEVSMGCSVKYGCQMKFHVTCLHTLSLLGSALACEVVVIYYKI